MESDLLNLSNKRDARRWARSLIAADIEANIDNGSFGLPQANDANPRAYALAVEALRDISRELRNAARPHG